MFECYPSIFADRHDLEEGNKSIKIKLFIVNLLFNSIAAGEYAWHIESTERGIPYDIQDK